MYKRYVAAVTFALLSGAVWLGVQGEARAGFICTPPTKVASQARLGFCYSILVLPTPTPTETPETSVKKVVIARVKIIRAYKLTIGLRYF